MCFSGKNTLIFLSPFPFLSAAIIAVPVLLLVGCCVHSAIAAIAVRVPIIAAIAVYTAR